MVAMGWALMLDPIAAVDEPTAGLAQYMEQIFQITRDVRDAGVSILLVSSTPSRRSPSATAATCSPPVPTGTRARARPCSQIAGEVAECFLAAQGVRVHIDFMDFLNFHLMPGVVLGSVYAVGAIGITLVFGILRFAHFAHGDMATLGAFIALALVTAGLTPWAALPVAMAAVAVVAIVVDKLFYDYLKAQPGFMAVMASLGVALMLRAVVQVVFGVDPRTYATGIVR